MSGNEHGIPEEWVAIGFTGAFRQEAVMTGSGPDGKATEDEVAAYAAKLPSMLPFGTNSSWMGVRVIPGSDPPAVLVVRKGEAAIMDLVRDPR